MFNKIRTAWQLPLIEKIWFLVLYPYSGLVRAAVLFIPFRYWVGLLGVHYTNVQLSTLTNHSQEVMARRIGRVIELTARYTIWESRCLVQALMAKTLLRFYGIPYVIYLGVKLPEETVKTMGAHAWTSVGNLIITGRKGYKSFAIVSVFVEPEILSRQIKAVTK
ncbi:lasso peptide biosynthesis B2 protein [Aliikangiella sp. IMCC44359]|uniref:lasso peptide biosynthesis B2 protein n=1 Tax=Aliikangiella sp. IMCC44359 TaxID=3459125 RepID=UPI00403AED4E